MAVMFSFTYCLAFIATVIFPGIEFNEVLSRSFERILLVVVAYFFGSTKDKKQNILNSERIENNDVCLDCNKWRERLDQNEGES